MQSNGNTISKIQVKVRRMLIKCMSMREEEDEVEEEEEEEGKIARKTSQ